MQASVWKPRLCITLVSCQHLSRYLPYVEVCPSPPASADVIARGVESGCMHFFSNGQKALMLHSNKQSRGMELIHVRGHSVMSIPRSILPMCTPGFHVALKAATPSLAVSEALRLLLIIVKPMRRCTRITIAERLTTGRALVNVQHLRGPYFSTPWASWWTKKIEGNKSRAHRSRIIIFSDLVPQSVTLLQYCCFARSHA